jgi:hypothetical protein
MSSGCILSAPADGAAGTLLCWSTPLLQKHAISEITRLGFATNCDGGLGLDAIDGDLIFCRRGRRR